MTRGENVLIGGEWRPADTTGTFQAINPSTGETMGPVYPVSSRNDVDAALVAGGAAATELLDVPPERIGEFLDRYADRIDERSKEIAETAHLETALPLSPRLADVELPRTSNQLRQAAAAARERSWTEPTIDTKANIRSMLGALGGPVAVFGPNNFPLAFNGVAGGDFAAAIAAGNPVIAKAHSSHPRTSQLLAEEAFAAVREASIRVLGMRHFDVQLIGGIVLHQGKIAEMKTGEGKTLAATLPLYLNAQTEKGVHLVTVNDYLARRDAEWMGGIYNFLFPNALI